MRLTLRRASGPAPAKDGPLWAIGSSAPGPHYVRFTPKSGHHFAPRQCPLCAISRHSRPLASLLVQAVRRPERHKARSGRTSSVASLVARFGGHGFLDLSLDGFQIEARAGLHRWKVDRCLGKLSHDLLDEHETPELEGEPVVIGDRAIVPAVIHASAFIGIEAQIGQDWPVHLLCRAKPTIGLVGEPILVVINADRAQCALCEVENLVSGRGTFAGDQIELIDCSHRDAL